MWSNRWHFSDTTSVGCCCLAFIASMSYDADVMYYARRGIVTHAQSSNWLRIGDFHWCVKQWFLIVVHVASFHVRSIISIPLEILFNKELGGIWNKNIVCYCVEKMVVFTTIYLLLQHVRILRFELFQWFLTKVVPGKSIVRPRWSLSIILESAT